MADNIIDAKEVLSRVNIVNIVKNYIPLIKKGRNYSGLCPFHNDNNPSLFVSEEKQIFKCFVCQTAGNAITFVQKKENISYREAVLKVAEMGGMDVSKYKNRTNDKYYKEKRCMSDLSQLYTSLIELNSNKEALEYCESRGLNREIREYFKIGYAPADGVKTLEAIKAIRDEDFNQIYSVKLFQDIGVSTYKNGNYRDINEDRIVFAISNAYNEVVAFSARYFRNNRPDDTPKYMNTKETVIFHKSDILYNYNNARSVAKETGYMYVVEGFMDVIALYKVGIKSAVALMGTAMSERHIEMLKRDNIEVRMCLDGDYAGQIATLDITKKLNKAGVRFRIVAKSDLAKDSDEILTNHGEEKLKEVLNTMISQQDFIINFYKSNLDLSLDNDKKVFIRNIFKEIVFVNDSLEIEEYATKLSKLTGYSKLNIQNELKKEKAKFETPAPSSEVEVAPEAVTPIFDYNREASKNTISNTRINTLEHLLIKLMLDDKELSKNYLNSPEISFFNPLYNAIHFYLREYLNENEEMSVADFINFIGSNFENSGDVVYEVSEIANEDTRKLKKEQVDKYVKELTYEKQMYILDKKIKSELNDENKSILMEKKRELMRNKNKIIK